MKFRDACNQRTDVPMDMTSATAKLDQMAAMAREKILDMECEQVVALIICSSVLTDTLSVLAFLKLNEILISIRDECAAKM